MPYKRIILYRFAGAFGLALSWGFDFIESWGCHVCAAVQIPRAQGFRFYRQIMLVGRRPRGFDFIVNCMCGYLWSVFSGQACSLG